MRKLVALLILVLPGLCTPKAYAQDIESIITHAAPSVAPTQAYNRVNNFGTLWKDIDANGCDTRNDILARDLVKVTYKHPGSQNCPGATVATGELVDPYTGATIHFHRGSSNGLVDIDHVIPLKWVWDKGGAQSWSQATREAFANDPDNLIAVDGPANRAKSNKGPALWMPENTAYQCQYATQWARIIDKYSVTLPADDREALLTTISRCDISASSPRVPAQPEATDAMTWWAIAGICALILAIAYTLTPDDLYVRRSHCH